MTEDILTSATPHAKIEGLLVALVASRTEIYDVKSKMEQEIAALEAKL